MFFSSTYFESINFEFTLLHFISVIECLYARKSKHIVIQHQWLSSNMLEAYEFFESVPLFYQ